MPTYDYRCKACGHTFELYQTMSEGEKRKCPQCAKNSLERLIGAGAGLIFKGSGYYLTDYRSKSYEEGAKAERDAAKPAETSSATPDSKGSASEKKDSATQNAAASAKDTNVSKPEGQSQAKPAAKTDGKSAPSAKKSSPKRKP
jgi:putative FmdB family regulatory protein